MEELRKDERPRVTLGHTTEMDWPAKRGIVTTSFFSKKDPTYFRVSVKIKNRASISRLFDKQSSVLSLPTVKSALATRRIGLKC